MANQYSARPGGGLVHVTYDFKHGKKLAAGIAGDMKRADTAILETHRMLAGELQWRQAEEFAKAVSGHGREQRRPVREGPVFKAIRSPKNRTVNLTGFTVGYLDDRLKFPHVADYAPGLENGTSVHVNRMLQGFWITPTGLQAPVEGAMNAIGFKGRVVDQGGFVIRNAIVGYGFQRKGWEAWKREEYSGKAAREQYEAYFQYYGLEFAARLFSRTGKRFTVSQLRSRFELQE